MMLLQRIYRVKISVYAINFTPVSISSQCAFSQTFRHQSFGKADASRLNIFRRYANEANFQPLPGPGSYAVPWSRILLERIINFFKVAKLGFSSSDFQRSMALSRHIQDNVPVREWCLIYDNYTTCLVHTMILVVLAGLFGCIVSTVRGAMEGTEHWKRFSQDGLVFGLLGVVWISLWLAICLFVASLYQRRALFRIYQSRIQPDQLLVRSSRGFFLREWVPVNRRDVKLFEPIPGIFDSNIRELFMSFWNGSVQVNGRAAIHNDNAFRNNAYRSYVFNLSDQIPRDLPTVDKFIENFAGKLAPLHADDTAVAAKRLQDSRDAVEREVYKGPKMPLMRFLRASIIPIVLGALYLKYKADMNQKAKLAVYDDGEDE